MSTHLTQNQLEEYSRQRLPVAELLSVTDHLDECEACRRRIEGATNDDSTFFSLRSEVLDDVASPDLETPHLTPEQTANYVDSDLSGDQLQIVTDHLSNCEVCSLAVDDLRAFKNAVAPSLGHEYCPVATSSESWWNRMLKPLPSLFRMSPVPAFGAALGVLLLALVGWVIFRTSREKVPSQEIAVSPATSPQSSAPVSPATSPAQTQSLMARVQLNDGGRVLTVDQQGTLSGADYLPPTYQNMMKKTLSSGRLEKSSQLAGLTRPGSSLMSSEKEAGQFSLIDPVGSVLMSDRPTFRWSMMEGATAYVVEVYDDKFQLVTSSAQLTTQSWTPAQSLPRGKVYSWQVKALKDEQETTSPRPPAPQAKFRVLDQAKANELSNAKRAYGSAHLTLGLLYANAGLLKEAEEEFRALQKANPDSELARGLLRQVQALRK